MIEITLVIVGLYAVVGVITAIALLARGLAKIDHGVAGTSIWFKLVIAPGLIAFWPLFLLKWKQAGEQENFPEPEKHITIKALRVRHGVQIQLLAVLLPILLGLSIWARPTVPINEQFSDSLAALPIILKHDPDYFSGFEVQTTLRADRYGWNHQIELEIGEVLPLEQPVLYWMPKVSVTDETKTVASQFIGFLKRPGTNRFAIPDQLATGQGKWVILSHQDFMALNPALKEKSA